MLWQENLNTRPNTLAKAEHSNTVHANPCQASVVLQTCSSRLFSLPPLLSNVKTSFETPSLDNSTVLLTVKHYCSLQLFVSHSKKESSAFCSTQIWKWIAASLQRSCSNHVRGASHWPIRLVLHFLDTLVSKSEILIWLVNKCNNTTLFIFAFYIVTILAIVLDM